MTKSYWDGLTKWRISRRRAVIGSAGVAASAALLLACGGGSGSGTPKTGDLVSPPLDTSKQAKRGGINRWYSKAEALHFDALTQGQASLTPINGLPYSSLVGNKPGYLTSPTNTDVVPDLAESWEFSPDGTQVTFKLRQGVKWHNKSPVNGRTFDSSDVVANWKRYESKGGERATLANSVNPNAPLVSVTATDAKTVVYKLKEPTIYIMQRLASLTTGNAGTVMPKETDNGFDGRTDQIGTGGFVLEQYRPSIGYTYKRNPEYWNKDEPHFDQVDVPIILEYATGLSQLKAGNIYTYEVRAEDILPAKRETPELMIYQNVATGGTSVGPIVGFGWLPLNGQKSPFLDVRVRQALSLSYDRDAFLDVFSNVSNFRTQGVPIDTYYFSSMAYSGDWWLDPRSKDFGPNGKFYTYDPAEAKKLMAAAGYANGFELPSTFIQGPQFGTDHQKQVEVLDSYAREVGFKSTPRPIDYALEYLPKIVQVSGKYEGWAWRWGTTPSADPVDFMAWRYWSKAGGSFLGFDLNGAGDGSGDAGVDQLVEKAKAELDANRRKALVWELQRYLGKMQYGVSRPGLATGLLIAWRALRNMQVFQGDTRGGNYTWWLDDSQAPLKKP